MATKIGTLQNPDKTEALLPRTCLKAVADKNGDYISEDVLASDINALKNGAIASLRATSLWTNSSATSDFISQTIPLDLSDYNFVLIYFKHYKAVGQFYTQIVIKGTGNVLFSCNPSLSWTSSSSVLQTAMRMVTVGSTGLTFGDGKYFNGADPMVDNNGVVIPIEIFGILKEE